MKHAEGRLARKRGSSIVEFLIAAPALALLIYVAMDLNQMMEYKQGLGVSSRNLAYIDPDSDESARKDRVKTDLKPFLGMEDVLVPSGTKGEIRGSEGHDRSVHGFDEERIKASLSDQGDPADGPSDSVYETTSAGIGSFTSIGTQALDTASDIANLFGVLGEYWILPRPELRSSEARLEIDGSTGLFRRALALSSAATEGKDSGTTLQTHMDETKDALTRKMSSVHVVRPESAYHPDGYVAQGLLGFLFGSIEGSSKKWAGNGGDSMASRPDYYNSQCLMNFDRGGPRCTDTNGYHSAVIWLGRAILAAMTAAKLSVIGLAPAIAAEVAQQVLLGVLDEVLNTAMDKLADEIGSQVTSKAQELLGGATPMEAIGGAAFDSGGQIIQQLGLSGIRNGLMPFSQEPSHATP